MLSEADTDQPDPHEKQASHVHLILSQSDLASYTIPLTIRDGDELKDILYDAAIAEI